MLTEARGKLDSQQQVALLIESLRSQSLGVRTMALQVSKLVTYGSHQPQYYSIIIVPVRGIISM